MGVNDAKEQLEVCKEVNIQYERMEARAKRIQALAEARIRSARSVAELDHYRGMKLAAGFILTAEPEVLTAVMDTEGV